MKLTKHPVVHKYQSMLQANDHFEVIIFYNMYLFDIIIEVHLDKNYRKIFDCYLAESEGINVGIYQKTHQLQICMTSGE